MLKDVKHLFLKLVEKNVIVWLFFLNININNTEQNTILNHKQEHFVFFLLRLCTTTFLFIFVSYAILSINKIFLYFYLLHSMVAAQLLNPFCFLSKVFFHFLLVSLLDFTILFRSFFLPLHRSSVIWFDDVVNLVLCWRVHSNQDFFSFSIQLICSIRFFILRIFKSLSLSKLKSGDTRALSFYFRFLYLRKISLRLIIYNYKTFWIVLALFCETS